MVWQKKLVASFLCLLVLGSGGYLVKDYHDYRVSQEKLASLQKEAVKESHLKNIDADFDKNMLRSVNLTKLKVQNGDTAMWLYVPETKIDGPVMQEPKVGEYLYDLNGFDKTYNGAGSFLIPKSPAQADGSKGEDAHTLILGHRMAGYNGEWQFSHLPVYWADKTKALDRPYIYTYSEGKAQRWLVWAASDMTSKDRPYVTPLPLNSPEYENMLDQVEAQARYTMADKPKASMQTLMLSTCHTADHGSEARFLLAAVLDAEYDYKTKTYKDMRDYAAQDIWTNKNKKAYEAGLYQLEQGYRDKKFKYDEDLAQAKKDHQADMDQLDREIEDLSLEIRLRRSGASAEDVLRALDEKKLERRKGEGHGQKDRQTLSPVDGQVGP